MLAMQKNPSIKAMIVGSAGQDGYYLGRSLLRDGIEIVGITRSGVLLPCETKIRPLVYVKCDEGYFRYQNECLQKLPGCGSGGDCIKYL